MINNNLSFHKWEIVYESIEGMRVVAVLSANI